jgi:hypothetical protein
MKTQDIKWQDIKWQDLTKVLKVGDEINSYMYGKGIVKEILIIIDTDYPICIKFLNEDLDYIKFTIHGMEHLTQLFPSIHLQEWNPLTDPFPVSKFEPIVGEWYAFWDSSFQFSFQVREFREFENGYYFDIVGTKWDSCAPIEEALELFKSKNSNNEKATETV